MSDLFARAASRQAGGRAVLFVDELDGLCRVRSGREEEHTRRLKTHLLQLMDGLLSGEGSGAATTTFLLAATNCPWDLDPAFLRRFQRRVYVPLPDRSVAARYRAAAGRHGLCTGRGDFWDEESWARDICAILM